MESWEEMAVILEIKGFSDKIFEFARAYIDIFIGCAEDNGFDRESVMHSIAKNKDAYLAGYNGELEDKAAHNRLLMLIPHTFHDKCMETVIEEQLDLKDNFDMTAFSPQKLLREKILNKITSIQVLVFGNSEKEDAVNFC